MPKAIDVATELYKLADSFKTNPDASVPRAFISFGGEYCSHDKEKFLSLVKLLPRPIKKQYDNSSITILHENPSVYIYASIDRSDVCVLVEPAKPAVYSCDPLLSREEEDEI